MTDKTSQDITHAVLLCITNDSRMDEILRGFASYASENARAIRKSYSGQPNLRDAQRWYVVDKTKSFLHDESEKGRQTCLVAQLVQAALESIDWDLLATHYIGKVYIENVRKNGVRIPEKT